MTGVVVGICTDRDPDQRRSIESIAEFSRPDTQLVAVFNGVVPFPVNPRYEIVHFPELLGREQGLWKYMYDVAVERDWDWAGTFHDDMHLLEAGWESCIEAACETHRVGVASYACWPYAAPHRTNPDDPKAYTLVTSNLPDGTLNPGFPGVAVDGCGMAFNMALFKQRKMFTPLNVACGYGETEAGFWALSQGWAGCQIQKNASHPPGLSTNTRGVLQLGAEGIEETVFTHLDVLPATVLDANRIQLGDKIVDFRLA